LTSASDWSGVVSPRAAEKPLVPMKATSTETSFSASAAH
jgi:hypothetical protein